MLNGDANKTKRVVTKKEITPSTFDRRRSAANVNAA